MLFVRRRFEGTSELFEVVAVGDKDIMGNDGMAIIVSDQALAGGHLFRTRANGNHNAQLSHDIFQQHSLAGTLSSHSYHWSVPRDVTSLSRVYLTYAQ
jgi:hypothetical protein